MKGSFNSKCGRKKEIACKLRPLYFAFECTGYETNYSTWQKLFEENIWKDRTEELFGLGFNLIFFKLIVFYFIVFFFSFHFKFSSDTSEQHTYSSQMVNIFTWEKEKSYARKLPKISVP